MDRSFTSPLMGRSPFSPRSRQSIGSKRVLPPSFRKSSRFSVSGKSTQSVQIILSSPYNYVERFGHPLPVLITEALTFSDRNTMVSARISKNGYAWIVCGRRLLIWQYRQSLVHNYETPQKKTGLLNQCFELQLPQSDLAHRAELVSVFVNIGSTNPSCLAVSPEGVVRYWPAIVHEGVSVEQHVNLHGQECDSLTEVEGLGSILATTTCTILLILPQFSGGRHSLKCHTLKIPTGWLGGIGKRMSSLIFGPINNEQSTETRMVRVLSQQKENDTWIVYVLADHTLQKWQISKNDSEEFIFVAELHRMVREGFKTALWENCVGDHHEIDTWLLDFQPDKDGVIILAAAVNLPVSPNVHYAMISIQTNMNQPPSSVKDFLLLKIRDLYREDNAGNSLSYRFLLSGTFAYLYNDKSIVVIKPQEDPDTLEFSSSEEFLLAGSICVNTPIFFSKSHGLVAVASNDMSTDLNLTCPNTPVESSFSEAMLVNNLSIYNMDPEEMTATYKDTLGQLKTAFIYHLKNQENSCKEILNEIFPVDTSKLPGIDSLLDKIVIMLCRDMLDDIPAGDPRWSKDAPLGLGSSYSMQILHQLEDKQKAHAIAVQFLVDSGLWGRLAACTIRNSTMATVYVIGEMSERLVAARTLKSLPFESTLEKAITKALDSSEGLEEKGLTVQDLFYKEVSQIHRGIQELVHYSEDVSHSDLNPSQTVEVINETNEIILKVLNEVNKHRQLNSERFKPSKTILSIAPVFLPWTAANGSEGLADSLLLLHHLTYNYGVLLTDNERLRNDLLEHLVAITDLMLDGRKSHLESIKGTELENVLYKQYDVDRKKFMKPLLKEKEWERAARLAEKYLDFETLVNICELTDNQSRLDEYLERFSNNGFSEYVYNWFLKENKQGKLLDKCRNERKTANSQKLTNFLSEHPSLAWMQCVFDKKYTVAADTLHKLALEETESVTTQKTMYSLAKLAKLAGPDAPDADGYLKNVNARLDLITLQEEIPDYVLQQFGYDTVNIRVIPPKDLINLYICKEYIEAGELEFKKGLDLLGFVEDDDLRQDLSLKVWRSALLRDSWQHTNLDSPLEILQNKLFFRLVELAMDLGSEPLNLLPPLDTLLDDESMKELQESKSFEYLIKAGYEHVYRAHGL